MPGSLAPTATRARGVSPSHLAAFFRLALADDFKGAAQGEGEWPGFLRTAPRRSRLICRRVTAERASGALAGPLMDEGRRGAADVLRRVRSPEVRTS